ncbi:MAG: hypothetical protein KTR25_17505, partial [Myxococcales bacterium]|nr:hypothetical protein [Myxococcales bacterium]
MSHCVKKTSLDVGWELADEAWLLPNGQPRKLGYTQLEWLPAQVPGYVHLDLCRHGVIVDPFEGLGELGCQWIDEATWIYRLRFHASMTPNLPKRVLRFNGVDTVCTVFLNDQALARHDNMFQALELDVSEHLRPGINEVMLRFESAPAVGRARRLSFFGREGLPDNVARFPERAFLRKAQYMFSWDWGPRLCSAGIWQPVHLLEFRSRLIDVWVKQHPLASGAFELSCHAEVEGEGDVYHRINGCWLADGQTHEILHPRLWWPTGLGSQELYTVESVLLPTGHTPGNNPSVLDQRHQRIGLRTISLERNPDTRGETFAFQVNGQALWAVGANWIPDHSFPSLVDRPRLRKQLERALDMNMNMIRIWGGGLYESDAFYELCDEMGLLVWQDFPFACSYVPDDPADQTALRSEATENIRRLRNHPCLALWCGNNENLTMWDSKWDEPLPQPGRYYGEHHYNEVLPAVLSEEDPTRPYIPSSPIGGNNANDGDVGDQHYWDVWHGRGDWVHYQDSTARFASEFGFAAAPGRSAWRKILAGHPDPFALDVRDRRARFHDKTDKGYETYLNYIERHYPEPKNLDELTYYSQLNQRD